MFSVSHAREMRKEAFKFGVGIVEASHKSYEVSSRDMCTMKRYQQLVFLAFSLVASDTNFLVVKASSAALLRPAPQHDNVKDGDKQKGSTPTARVQNFALVDMTTNQTIVASIQPENNFVLDLTSFQQECATGDSQTPPKLTIRVDCEGPSIHYIVLDLDNGRTLRTIMRPPFTLGHSLILLTTGEHTLHATPFDRWGRAGEGRTLSLRVLGGRNDQDGPPTIGKQGHSEQRDKKAKHSNNFVRPPTPSQEQQQQQEDTSDELPHNNKNVKRVKLQIAHSQNETVHVASM